MVDSLCVRETFLESMFIYNEDYNIQTIKSKSIFEPKIWRNSFGKSLTRNIIGAKIIHTYLGLTLPLKTFAATPKSQTLEFAGLHGYNERSELLVQTLGELESQLDYTRVTRIDVAIDFEGNIPHSITKSLCKTREPFRWKNTTYFKTKKEKKVNRRMDIRIYDKALHAKLDYPLMRLEFCFKSEYLKKLLLKDIETAYKKMEKSIKKATGLNVKIEHILSPKCERMQIATNAVQTVLCE